jgi:uncharacterized protein (TIGR03435 family)
MRHFRLAAADVIPDSDRVDFLKGLDSRPGERYFCSTMLLLKHVAAALLAFTAHAQSFEVASVKPSATTGGLFKMTGGPGTSDPGRITYTNVPLRIVLLTAYDVRNYQLTGPDWLNTLRYDVTARLPEGATKEQLQAMLRNLLETRFRLTLHRESKEAPIYDLVVARKGPKIKPVTGRSQEGAIASALPGVGADGFPKLRTPSPGLIIETKDGVARITAKEVTMLKFADMLTGQSHRPVFDRTGLAGTYDFNLYFTPEGAARSDSPDSDLFAALKEQLGLRLESRNGPVELLVIDHAEKTPVEN